ncbi:MAG: PH domain-containing protein [Actinomycetaceae bacterium]
MTTPDPSAGPGFPGAPGAAGDVPTGARGATGDLPVDARDGHGGGGDLPVDAGDGWRRVHPVTPVLLVWQVIAALLAVAVFQVSRELIGTGGWTWVTNHVGLVLLWVGLVLLAVIVVTGVYSALAWRRMRYRVDADGVELNQGILFRQQRRASLTRVQAVEVHQPLLGRLFGLGRVRVETAGGSDSNVDISFLRLSDANALRAEILARAAGVDLDQVRVAAAHAAAGGAGTVGADATGGASSSGRDGRDSLTAARTAYREAPERVLFEVDNGRLVASTMLTLPFIFTALFIVAAVVVVISGAPLGVLTAVVPGVLGAGGFLWSRFSTAFGFTSATSPDGIRIRRGLLETISQTVPPRRVQAVRLTQPLLWRWRGWWRVEAYIAGYGGEEASTSAQSGVLMPVGSRGDALTALWLVVPDIGVDDVPAVLDASLAGRGEAAGYAITPRRARVIDPFVWSRQGLLVTREAMLMRAGLLTRTLDVVPHGRTQSVGISQGPIERRLGIANLHMHTVPGPGIPTVPHLDQDQAAQITFDAAAWARQARGREGLAEWAERVGVPDGGSGDVADGGSDAGGTNDPARPGPAVDGVDGADGPDGADGAHGASAGDGSDRRRGPDGGTWLPAREGQGPSGTAT